MFYLSSIQTRTYPTVCNRACAEGDFLWLSAKQLFEQEAVLVDDLHYLFPDYLHKETPFFAYAKLNEKEKVEKVEIRLTG